MDDHWPLPLQLAVLQYDGVLVGGKVGVSRARYRRDHESHFEHGGRSNGIQVCINTQYIRGMFANVLFIAKSSTDLSMVRHFQGAIPAGFPSPAGDFVV